MFKHCFFWKYQYNKYMFNFIHIYSFIPMGVVCSLLKKILVDIFIQLFFFFLEILLYFIDYSRKLHNSKEWNLSELAEH